MKNIVEYNIHTSVYGSLLCKLPSDTGIDLVDKPVGAFGKRAAQHRASSARLRAADNARNVAREEIEAAAAAAADDDTPVDSKKLLRKQRAADDAYDEVMIEHKAIEHAVRKSHAKVVEAVRFNAAALRAEAASAVEADVLKLATLHSRLRDLQTELEIHLGLLGVTDSIFDDAIPHLRPSLAGGQALAWASEASDRLATAVGSTQAALDAAKHAAEQRVDVVVPMPGEDVVPDPAGEPMVITAEADD